ncbi:MAG TPA: heparinase, partial [Chitinophagaceae bacterium]|nr:heparinase [Chitinophagaceae bacterium]
MKHIFKQLFGSFILLMFVFDLNAQVNNKADLQITQQHPRILLFKGEEANLVSSITKDPVWSMLHNAIIKESDRIITVAPIQRIQIGRRLLDKSREALKRLFYLSYAYRTTNDQKYLVRAENEMLVIAGFSDWNPSHFLDVAEMTMAMSIGYDWLFDQLSQSSKDSIQNAIIKKGIEPSLDSKNNSWL